MFFVGTMALCIILAISQQVRKTARVRPLCKLHSWKKSDTGMMCSVCHIRPSL